MEKSQLFLDISKAYSNIFPNGNDSFNKIMGKSNCTAYGDSALLALFKGDDGIMFINSVSKEDTAFPFGMLKDMIHVVKREERFVFMTTKKDETRRLVFSLGAIEFENGFIKGGF